MNPTLAEDIMRQRAHRSVIVLATLLAWLLVTADGASAQITIIVPVDVTNLHENVTGVMVVVVLLDNNGNKVQQNSVTVPVVDGSVQEDVEVTGDWLEQGVPIVNSFESYEIKLVLSSSDGICTANQDYTTGSKADNPNFDHCRQGWHTLQTYAIATGPRSDVVRPLPN
mgnify:CR=1 FL=1